MSPARLVLVHVGLFALVGGSAFDMLTGREHWPFSPYAMFSEVKRDTTTTRLYLYGIPEGASGEEVPLIDEAFLRPFSTIQLHTALRKTQYRFHRLHGDSLLRVAVRDCARRYERRRRAGRHDGPPLERIRLYALHWRLEPYARNAARPDRRELILDVDLEG